MFGKNAGVFPIFEFINTEFTLLSQTKGQSDLFFLW